MDIPTEVLMGIPMATLYVATPTVLVILTPIVIHMEVLGHSTH